MKAAGRILAFMIIAPMVFLAVSAILVALLGPLFVPPAPKGTGGASASAAQDQQSQTNATPMAMSSEEAQARLDTLWAAGDWNGVVNLLEKRERTPAQEEAYQSAKINLTEQERASIQMQLNALWAAGDWNGVVNLLNGRNDLTPAQARALESARQNIAFSQATATATARRAAAKLELLSFKCTTNTRIGFVYIEGQVRNITNTSLRNVEAVGTWYTAADQFITSDTALIEYNPILPGQTSPFKTIGSYNPAMAKCQIEFKELLGGTIPTYREN